MQRKEGIKQLFERYKRGECSPEEETRLHSWLNHYAKHEAHGLDELEANYRSTVVTSRRLPWLKWSSFAAAAIVIIVAVWYFNDSSSNKPNPEIAQQQANDIALPDHNSALLTLADGREITLNEKSKGLLAQESGVKITQATDGSLTYEVVEAKKSDKLVYNNFKTPKGSTYQILLPDGTKVWLNAASTLRYPVTFTGDERRVSLSGEAYFEVARNAKQPFYVDARGSTIRVLGTHFNVYAYENEQQLKTTLVEGAVNVSKDGQTASLKPDQQATIDLSTGKIVRTETDVWSALAWKNGYFKFERASLEDIFVAISRWYDIEEIEYKGEFDNRFTGTFQRSKNVSELFRYLEKLAPIHFEIKERRVVVMK